MLRLTNKPLVKTIVGAGVILLVIGGIWSFTKSRRAEEQVSPEITLESSKMMTSDAVLKSPMSEAEKQTIEKTFAEQGAEMTVLKDVSGGQAVGTAWRSFDGKNFVHKVEASRLPGLEKGFYYEGWLVGDEGFFSTGRIAAEAGEAKLYYTADSDKSSFRGVVVTLEPEDGNMAPDKHILEGSF